MTQIITKKRQHISFVTSTELSEENQNDKKRHCVTISNDKSDSSIGKFDDIFKLQATGEILLKKLNIEEPFILLVKNDLASVACILAAEKRKSICVLLPYSRLSLFDYIKNQTGISKVIESCNDGCTLVFHQSDGMEESSIDLQPNSSWINHPKLIESGGVGLITSGSTGMPKIVISSWNAMIAQGQVTQEHLFSGSTNRFIVSSSIGHAYAINSIFAVLSAAKICKCHLYIVSETEKVAELLREKTEMNTILFGTPGLYVQLLELEGPFYLNKAFSAGVHLPTHTTKSLLNVHGLEILQNYGSTETGNIAAGGVNNSLSYTELVNYEFRDNHVGSLWPGVNVRFMPPTNGCRLDPKMEGEIVVSTPWLSIGYVDSGFLVETGAYFRTGDQGLWYRHLNSDKIGLVVGNRVREPIPTDVNGFTILIQPHEVEEAMMEHEKISNVLIPYNKHKKLIALVVLHESAHPISANEIMEWCKKRLPPCCTPSKVKVVQYFQCSPAGKLLYHM